MFSSKFLYRYNMRVYKFMSNTFAWIELHARNQNFTVLVPKTKIYLKVKISKLWPLKDMVLRIEVLRLFMQNHWQGICCWHHSYIRGRSGGGTIQLLSQHNAEFSCVTVFYFVAFLNVGSLLAWKHKTSRWA